MRHQALKPRVKQRLEAHPPSPEAIRRVKRKEPCGYCLRSKSGECRRCRDIKLYLYSVCDNQMEMAFD